MLEILYEDEQFVAVNKPPGLFVHPTDLAPGEASCLPILREQLGHWVYPVHRLDRATSGVMVFARSREAAGLLGIQFDQRAVRKV